MMLLKLTNLLLVLQHPLVVHLLLKVALSVVVEKFGLVVCCPVIIMVYVVAHIARFLLTYAIIISKLRICCHDSGQILRMHYGRGRCDLLSSI